MSNLPNRKKMDDDFAKVIRCITLILLTYLALMLGIIFGKESMKKEAVRNGAGEWGNDKKGRVEFQWVTNSLTLNED